MPPHQPHVTLSAAEVIQAIVGFSVEVAELRLFAVTYWHVDQNP